MSRKASTEGRSVAAEEDCIVNPQQRLYFLPLLHGQGEFRPILGIYVNLQTRQHGKTVSSSIVMLGDSCIIQHVCGTSGSKAGTQFAHTRGGDRDLLGVRKGVADS